jgi:precorrin-6B methylase 2
MQVIIPYLVLLAAVLLVLSVLVFQAITGVPPVSSGTAEGRDVTALLEQAGLPERPVIYELGCGWGSLVVALARAFPDAQIRGIELSPLPFVVAAWRTRNLPNVRIHRADFYASDLGNADAVTCYLMTGAMPRLAAYLDAGLKRGTPVVAVSFMFRGRSVSAVRQAGGALSQVGLYRWPAREGL